MKTMAKVVLGAAVCVLAAVSAAVAAPASGNGRPVGSQGGQELRRSYLKWWQEARFGMFVHFGLYAIPARGEWVKERETIPEEVYDGYFRRFDPNRFDVAKWAKSAKAAGMRYAVLTAKHHDGFCLWDSAFTPTFHVRPQV